MSYFVAASIGHEAAASAGLVAAVERSIDRLVPAHDHLRDIDRLVGGP